MVDILVEGKKLDVFENLDFSFNYAIADVREPDKRTTEYTKTIKCPATQNNDALFGHIYDFNIANPYNPSLTNIDVNFNPAKKASVEVLHDGIRIMKGSIQLRRIVREKVGMVYEVVFVGQLVSIFSVLGDKMLGGNDSAGVNYIDFSDLDHQYTMENQVASWSAPIGSGYVYPMIDRGKSIDYHATGYRIYRVGDLNPAFYLIDIIRRVFEFAGFSYTSTFFDSAFFNRLIVPVNDVRSEDGPHSDRLFRAVKTTPQSMQYYDIQLEGGNGNEDAFYFDTSSAGIYKPIMVVCYEDDTIDGFDNGTQQSFGNYLNPTTLNGYQPYDYAWHVSDENQGIYQVNASALVLLKERYNGDIITADNHTTFAGQAVLMRSRYGSHTIVASEPFSFNVGEVSSGDSGFTNQTQNIQLSTEVIAQAGDRYWIELRAAGENGYGFWFYTHNSAFSSSSSWTDWYDMEMYIIAGSFSNTYLNAGLQEGEQFYGNANVPNVKMAELLMSVFKMFNLYVLPNPDKDNDLIIETYNDFYSGGVAKDWSHKLDYSQNVTLQPLALLTASEYRFTYTEDGDYYNDRYQSNHGHVHGRRVFDVDNDFIQNTHTTEIVFSPSPLVNDGNSNRLIPKVYDSDIEEGVQPTDSNIRVLYYGGLLTSTPEWVHRKSFVSGQNYPDDTYRAEYPYAGHLTHPLSPAQDIHFGIPLELFYTENNNTGPISITNNNLFNTFHRKYLEEITDKDSKLLTGYFHLDPLDIHNLDFRDHVIIDNSMWRINKVENYNPFKEGLTKVELLKVVTKSQVSGKKKSMNGSGPYEDEQYPVKKKTKTNKNNYPDFQGVVRGSNNEVSPSANNFDINGDGNTIGDGADNIIIRGDNNTIREGVTNVTLINTNGVTIDSSNHTYINNIEQGGADIVEGGEDEVRGLFSDVPVFVIDGGEDEVNEQFSQTAIYVLEGNGNTGQ